MNNTKTNSPSWGQYSGSPSPVAPWCAASSQCGGILRRLHLTALDVPICLLLADARDQSCHFIGRPPELLGGGTLELICPPPCSDEAPSAYDLPREVPVFVHLLGMMTRLAPKLRCLLFPCGIMSFTGRLVPGFLLCHLLLERHLPSFLSRQRRLPQTKIVLAPKLTQSWGSGATSSGGA